MTTNPERENSMLRSIEAALDNLESLNNEFPELASGPPPANDPESARLFGAYDAAQAAAGRLQDAADLLHKKTTPEDNPAPFEDLPALPSLELYQPFRIMAALMSMLRDHETHPSAYEQAAHAMLRQLPDLTPKIETAMLAHSHSDLLAEILYDDATRMAEAVRSQLTSCETNALLQAAALADGRA